MSIASALGAFLQMPRSYEHEIMDSAEIPEEELARVYRGIEATHRRLGNHRAILQLLRQEPHSGERPTVLDIGCGQGALLADIERELGFPVIGLELRPPPLPAKVRIVCGNAVRDPLPPADVAICMAVVHHLTEAELTEMIANVARTCRRFIVLDLVRHRLPLALFRLFVAPFLSRINALDGVTSIRRALTSAEMRRIVNDALACQPRQVESVTHSVAPGLIRQTVDIRWR